MAPELSHLFPEEDRRRIARQAMVPGNVLYLPCWSSTPPKDKFAVLLSIGDPCLLFWINREIRDFLKKDPVRVSCQVCLDPSDHPFLKCPSYLDCTTVIYHLKEAKIIALLVEDSTRIRGELSPEAVLSMKDAVTRAKRTVSNVHRNLILSSFH